MTSLCIIADTHRRHRELAIPECDILIHCGDICSFQQEDQAILEDTDAWFAEVPARHVLCTGGNHDFLLERREFKFAHAQLLQDRLIEVGGLSIYGAPWCPDLSGFAFYKSGDELLEKWKLIPAGIDVLVTHTPPYGILDLPTSGNVHLGCKHLLHELERIQPRLHVFGHVHASYGSFADKKTQYFNAAMVGGKDFTVRNCPVLYEFPSLV